MDIMLFSDVGFEQDQSDNDAIDDDIEDKIADFEDNMRVISNNFIKRYKVGSVPFMPYNSFRS